jgi:CRISPR-associated protein Cas8b1/Cst1 subtype I-B
MAEFPIRFIGHPVIDCGISVAMVRQKRTRPEELTWQDLLALSEGLFNIYSRDLKGLKAFMINVFPNSGIVQPKITKEQRHEYLSAQLKAFVKDVEAQKDDDCCVFFPRLKAVMRADRRHFPLLNGEGVPNFSSMGRPGLSLSGLALLFIHAMPLGIYRYKHFLLFHQLTLPSQMPRQDMNLVLARKAVEKFDRAIHFSLVQDNDEALRHGGEQSKTRFIQKLAEVIQETNARGSDLRYITGYYFSNNGNAPSLRVLRLTDNITDFIVNAQQDFSDAWRTVVFRGWQGGKQEDDLTSEAVVSNLRNEVYETLFNLPKRNRQFIWMLSKGREWGLITLFLRKVIRMDKDRIDTYRNLGDKLTQYMLNYGNGSLSFYYEFSRAKTPQMLRNIIKTASERMVKAGNPPLFSYQEFILAFEHPSDTFSTWKTGRDLIAIRMLEMLHQHRNSVNLEELPDEFVPEEEE